MGVLQRIIPFLAAMNANKEGHTPPRLSELAQETPLKIHAICHFTALALVSLGISYSTIYGSILGKRKESISSFCNSGFYTNLSKS